MHTYSPSPPIYQAHWRSDRLAAIAKKSGLEIDCQRFRNVRNEVNRLINQSYQGYLNTVIGNLGEDS